MARLQQMRQQVFDEVLQQIEEQLIQPAQQAPQSLVDFVLVQRADLISLLQAVSPDDIDGRLRALIFAYPRQGDAPG